jgi:hypothetical protein
MSESQHLLAPRLRQKRRFPYVISVAISLVFLLYFFVPFLYTVFNSVKTEVLGYWTLAYYQDEADWLHYGVLCLILSFFFSCASLIASFFGLFLRDEEHRLAFPVVIGFLALKAIADIVSVCLFSLTATNVALDWGGYLNPVLSVFLLFAFLAFYVNMHGSEESFATKAQKKALKK